MASDARKNSAIQMQDNYGALALNKSLITASKRTSNFEVATKIDRFDVGAVG